MTPPAADCLTMGSSKVENDSAFSSAEPEEQQIEYGHKESMEDREVRVAFFIRQILQALRLYHISNTAHLDIRPENITLSETTVNQVNLISTGQERVIAPNSAVHVTEIHDPEFSAPEVVRAEPVNLGTDMCDCDRDTLRNVCENHYSFNSKPFHKISENALDFISGLLSADSHDRPTVDTALEHTWLTTAQARLTGDLEAGQAVLNANFLKEFKYRHRWVARRVFVKTSSDASTDESVSLTLSASDDSGGDNTTLTSPLFCMDQCDSATASAQLNIRLQAPSHSASSQLPPQVSLTTDALLDYPLLGGSSNQLIELQTIPTIEEFLLINAHRSFEDEIANRVLSDISEESEEVCSEVTGISGDGIKTPTIPDNLSDQLDLAVLLPEYHHHTMNGPDKNVGALPPDDSIMEASTKTVLMVEIDSLSPATRRLKQNSLSPSVASSSTAPPPKVVHSPHSPREVEIVAIVRSGANTPITDRSMSEQQATRSLMSPDFDALLANVDRAKTDFAQRVAELHDLNTRLETVADFADVRPKLELPPVSDERERDRLDWLLSRGTKPRPQKMPSGVDLDAIDAKYEGIFDWHSDYQTGPETYLLSARDPALAARLRDYRRHLFGDEASIREQSIVHSINQDIAVRERRHYKDMVKTDKDIQEAEANLEEELEKLLAKTGGLVRRRRGPEMPSVVFESKSGSGHAPIFRQRLRHEFYSEDGVAQLHCTVYGSPAPTVSWFRNSGALGEDQRFQTSYNERSGVARLRIQPAYATDAGIYSCQASNDSGDSVCSARLRLAAYPDKPGRPEIEIASDTELFVRWDPPKTPVGASDVIAYRLEFRKLQQNDWSCPWILISNNISDECVVLRQLSPNTVYQFRVLARSLVGTGEPSLSSRLIQMHERGAPKLQIDAIRTDFSVTILNAPQQQSAMAEIAENAEESEEERSVAQNAGNADVAENGVRSSGHVQLDTSSTDPRKRYQLADTIHRGRFSVLRTAMDQESENDSHCVVKIVSSNAETGAAANSEFELLSSLRHSNIVTLHSAYLRNGYILLIMERLSDPLLERFSRCDFYTEETLARLSQQLLSALQWIHFKRIAHLDLEPDNVIFANPRSWTVKLCDFGSATQLNSEGETRPDRVISPEYSAPELLQHGYVTPSTDVWGLGVLIYILASGFHPFASFDDPEERIINNIVHAKLDINYIYSNASEEMLKLLTWCLKKHPGNRMSTEEGLEHRWFSLTDTQAARRENVRFSSHRLRIFAQQYSAWKQRHVAEDERVAERFANCPFT